jgi:hypothetical protein
VATVDKPSLLSSSFIHPRGRERDIYMPLFYWVGCPACGWGTVLDTQQFRASFGFSPRKGWKVWCPHCRGEPGRKPLTVISLGKKGKEIGELLWELKRRGIYTLLPKHHKLPFSSFASDEMMSEEVEPPMPMGENPLKRGKGGENGAEHRTRGG